MNRKQMKVLEDWFDRQDIEYYNRLKEGVRELRRLKERVELLKETGRLTPEKAQEIDDLLDEIFASKVEEPMDYMSDLLLHLKKKVEKGKPSAVSGMDPLFFGGGTLASSFPYAFIKDIPASKGIPSVIGGGLTFPLAYEIGRRIGFWRAGGKINPLTMILLGLGYLGSIGLYENPFEKPGITHSLPLIIGNIVLQSLGQTRGMREQRLFNQLEIVEKTIDEIYDTWHQAHNLIKEIRASLKSPTQTSL